jgi:rRNA maturation protein Nop10
LRKPKVVCKECGADAPIDKEKSNENWTVHKNKCDKCGGSVKFSF